MKKTNIFLGIVSTVLISGFIFASSNNINPNLNNNTRYMSDETHVSTFEELSDALNNSRNKVIVFDNDIDLSNFTPEDVIYTNSIRAFRFTIDGNGHGFVNKPSEYYSTSIFDDFYIYENNAFITFRNLTLDNVGSFINQINIVGTEDYDALFSDPSEANLIGKGLTFQNITIKNNLIKNKNSYLTPYINNFKNDQMYQFLSLLINDAFIYHTGNELYDEAITFSNIVIENNHIDNNNFYIVNDSFASINVISETFLANLEFLTCGYADHHHHSFITYEYIYIKNNSFTKNAFKIGHYSGNDFIFEDFNSSISESFGQLSGNANGLSGQVGTNGNYLMIHDIYISNNQISESKKENADGNLVIDHYNYSELISNSNLDLKPQYISILDFENIFIFNNEAHYLNESGNYELSKQEDLTLLNITFLDKDNNPNTWDNLNFKNLFIYGPMYDSSKELKIFKDASLTLENNINYGKYLFIGDEAYYELTNLLINNFGIYGYQIDFEQVEDNGQIKNAVSSISKVNEDHIDIFYDNLIYEGKKTLNISKIELSFRYYQAFDENQIVDVPYQISNLKLYNDQNSDQKFEQGEIIATSEQIYSIQDGIYHVNLKLENEVELNQELIDTYDLDNLYLGFDYSNDSNQKVTSNTILKINPDQLRAYFPGFPELDSKASTSVIVISSISAIVLFIILIILLVLLILWLLKRKNKNKIDVQDEYYEYAEDPNYFDNQDYSQDSYYEDNNYLDYQNQTYDYDNQTYDYDNQNYDNQNYDYQDYNYEDQNLDDQDYNYQDQKNNNKEQVHDYKDKNYNNDQKHKYQEKKYDNKIKINDSNNLKNKDQEKSYDNKNKNHNNKNIIEKNNQIKNNQIKNDDYDDQDYYGNNNDYQNQLKSIYNNKSLLNDKNYDLEDDYF